MASALGSVLVAASAGCGVALTAGGGLGIDLLSEDDGGDNAAPAESITTPTGVLTDVVAVEYRLADPEGDRVSVLVEYSAGGGDFLPATQAVADDAEGTVNLTASLQGEPHTFFWNSSADLGFVDVQEVRVRVTPRASAAAAQVGPPAATGSFDLSNTFMTTLAERARSGGVLATGLAWTSDDALILADALGQRVIRLDTVTGQAEVLAGTGDKGFNGSGKLGSEVQLNGPFTVAAVPGTGGGDDVLVSDAGNARVRRIDGQTGFVTEVAGGGSQGGEDVLGPNAQLALADLAADAGGNAFFVDLLAGARVRAINLESGDDLLLPVGDHTSGLGCTLPGSTLAIGPGRVSTTLSRDTQCRGASAFAFDVSAPSALAVYDDGLGDRRIYLLETPATGGNEAATGPATFPRLTVTNLGGGAFTVQPLSDAAVPVSVDPGDIAVVASGADLGALRLQLLPDLAVHTASGPGVLLLSAAEENAVFALNVSTIDATVAGVAVAAGGRERVVGTGVQGGGGDGEAPLQAQLTAPCSVVSTPAGHIIVGELIGRVRVAASPSQAFPFGPTLTVPAGTVDTLPVRLPGLEPRILRPLGLSLTPAGDLLVTDTELLDPRSNRLLRIAADDGALEPLLGSGVFGDDGDGGPALEASLGSLGLPAVTADGGLVLAPDFTFHRVRAVNLGDEPRTFLGVTIAPGAVETVVGTGEKAADPTDPAEVGDGLLPSLARVTSPLGVAFGPQGLLWVSDSGANRLRVCNPGAQPVTVLGVTIAPDQIETVLGRSGVAGTPADDAVVAAADALLEFPVAFFGADGLLYVADGLGEATRPRVRAVNLGAAPVVRGGVDVAPGTIVRVIGSGAARDADNLGDGGPALSATFRNVSGLSVRADGVAFVSDQRDHRLRVVNLGAASATIGGVTLGVGEIETLAGTGQGGFDPDPSGLASPFFGSTEVGRLNEPFTTVAFPDGRLLLADSANGALRLLNVGSAPRAFAGAFADPGQMVVVAGSRSGRVRPATPGGMQVAAGGRTIFSDLGAVGDEPRILELDPASRVVNLLAGSGETTAPDGSNLGDGGPARLATLRAPTGLGLDDDGAVYVCDSGNGRVRFVNRTAAERTPVAGVTVAPGGIDTVVTGLGPGNLPLGDENLGDDVGLPVTPTGGPELIEEIVPLGVARSGGILWVADAAGRRVLRVNAASATLESHLLGSEVEASKTTGSTVPAVPRALQDGTGFGGTRRGDRVIITASDRPLTLDGQPATLPVLVTVDVVGATSVSIDRAITTDGAAANLTYRVVRPALPVALVAISETVALVASQEPGGAVVRRVEWQPAASPPSWADATPPLVGSGGSGWNGDRLTATAMNFTTISALDLDGDLLLVADSKLHRVVAVNLGAVDTLQVAGRDVLPGEARTVAGAGAGKLGFNGDALPAHLALLNDPGGVAFWQDPSGGGVGIYLSDRGNGRIRRFQK